MMMNMLGAASRTSRGAAGDPRSAHAARRAGRGGQGKTHHPSLSFGEGQGHLQTGGEQRDECVTTASKYPNVFTDAPLVQIYLATERGDADGGESLPLAPSLVGRQQIGARHPAAIHRTHLL
jgi:hypothetical protein